MINSILYRRVNLQVSSNMNALFDGLSDMYRRAKNRAELGLRGGKDAVMPKCLGLCTRKVGAVCRTT
jgi:hypothetical protein